MSPGAGHAHQGAWRFGCAAAVVFVLAGFFIVKAAVLQREAGEGAGRGLPFGGQPRLRLWLLASLASGLLCYGLYCRLETGYRNLTPGR
jgi:hypothetical protein